VATTTSKGVLTLRSVPSGQTVVAPIQVSPERAAGVAFSADGRDVLAGTHEGTVVALDARTGRAVAPPLHVTSSGETYAVVLSSDGQTLATGTESGPIRLWDAATGRPRGPPLRFHRSTVYVVAFSSDGRLLASSGDDGEIAIWDVATGRRLGEALRGHGELVTDLAFTGPHTLVSAAGGEVARWDLDAVALGRQGDTGQGDVRALALSPAGTDVVTGGADHGTLARFGIASAGATRPTVDTGLRRIDALEWEPNGTLIVGGSDSTRGDTPQRGRLLVWPA
jgi:WD40 repeat protein